MIFKSEKDLNSLPKVSNSTDFSFEHGKINDVEVVDIKYERQTGCTIYTLADNSVLAFKFDSEALALLPLPPSLLDSYVLMNDNNSIQRSTHLFTDRDITNRTGSSRNYDPSKPTVRFNVNNNTEVTSNLPESHDIIDRRNTRKIFESDDALLTGRHTDLLPESKDSIFNFDPRSSEFASGNENDSDTIDV